MKPFAVEQDSVGEGSAYVNPEEHARTLPQESMHK